MCPNNSHERVNRYFQALDRALRKDYDRVQNFLSSHRRFLPTLFPANRWWGNSIPRPKNPNLWGKVLHPQSFRYQQQARLAKYQPTQSSDATQYQTNYSLLSTTFCNGLQFKISKIPAFMDRSLFQPNRRRNPNQLVANSRQVTRTLKRPNF